MAILSQAVRSLAESRYYCRSGKAGRQTLVYQARIDSTEPVILLLPLPVPNKTMIEDVRFLEFKNYAAFFLELGRGFPAGAVPPRPPGVPVDQETKAYVEVELGTYEASFVPSQSDLAKLDDRWSPGAAIWKAAPEYSESGFVVLRIPAGHKRLPLLGVDFPRSKSSGLYFPTRHIVADQIPKRGPADDLLYAQLDAGEAVAEDWIESARPAGFFVRSPQGAAIVNSDAHVYLRRVIDQRRNADVTLK